MNLFSELGAYFKEKYFSPDLSAIKNFETYDIQRFLPYIIVGLCAGVFIAICCSYYVNHYLGRVVRALYKQRIFTEKEAKGLSDLGVNEYLIRRSLFRDTIVSKYVKSVTPLESMADAKTALFYLPEETRYTADKRFKETKHGALMIILSFFICLSACFALLLFVPEILQLADNVITMVNG